MESTAHRPTWKTLLAFGIIYFAWGSTYLAIRIGVQEVPPFLFAAMRFFLAGVCLLGWSAWRREPWPAAREWGSAALLSIPFFVLDYGPLFWAEQRVPSGLAAVMMATIPAFIAVAEILLLRTQALTARLAIALVIGIGGVAVLVSRSLNLGGAPIETVGAVALIFASISWSVATVLTRILPLPASKSVSSGAQMFFGGIFLAITASILGETRRFHFGAVSGEAWFALVYLIIVGSIAGFTAYLWLIHHESPTKVGTYAYVNPVVAVLVGYFLGGEALGSRTVLGTLLILVSVVVITISKAKSQPARVTAAKGATEALES